MGAKGREDSYPQAGCKS